MAVKTGFGHNARLEAEFRAECTSAGRECLSAREAAELFGCADVTIRQAAHQGRIEPVFSFLVGKKVPAYRLSDLEECLRASPDPQKLAEMRAHGLGCWMTEVSPGGWLLLGKDLIRKEGHGLTTRPSSSLGCSDAQLPET